MADKKSKMFRWTGAVIEDLVSHLQNYKYEMSYSNVDFNSDKPLQYAELRKKRMSEKYKDNFGEQDEILII